MIWWLLGALVVVVVGFVATVGRQLWKLGSVMVDGQGEE